MKKVVVFGLGNPGAEYLTTRHNAGRILLDDYAESRGFLWKRQEGVYVSKAIIDDCEVFLMKSLSYMNESGKDLGRWLRYHNFDEPPFLLVLQDDSDQNFGKMKLAQGGGSAGHWGVESLYHSLLAWYQRDEIWRLKIGIRPYNNTRKSETFVLKPFALEELKSLKTLNEVIFGSEFLHLLINKNPNHAQSIINSLSLKS